MPITHTCLYDDDWLSLGICYVKRERLGWYKTSVLLKKIYIFISVYFRGRGCGETQYRYFHFGEKHIWGMNRGSVRFSVGDW